MPPVRAIVLRAPSDALSLGNAQPRRGSLHARSPVSVTSYIMTSPLELPRSALVAPELLPPRWVVRQAHHAPVATAAGVEQGEEEADHVARCPASADSRPSRSASDRASAIRSAALA